MLIKIIVGFSRYWYTNYMHECLKKMYSSYCRIMLRSVRKNDTDMTSSHAVKNVLIVSQLYHFSNLCQSTLNDFKDSVILWNWIWNWDLTPFLFYKKYLNYSYLYKLLNQKQNEVLRIRSNNKISHFFCH